MIRHIKTCSTTFSWSECIIQLFVFTSVMFHTKEHKKVTKQLFLVFVSKLSNFIIIIIIILQLYTVFNLRRQINLRFVKKQIERSYCEMVLKKFHEGRPRINFISGSCMAMKTDSTHRYITSNNVPDFYVNPYCPIGLGKGYCVQQEIDAGTCYFTGRNIDERNL